MPDSAGTALASSGAPLPLCSSPSSSSLPAPKRTPALVAAVPASGAARATAASRAAASRTTTPKYLARHRHGRRRPTSDGAWLPTAMPRHDQKTQDMER